MTSDDFLTVTEVAKRLRVTTTTIYRWMEEGRLPAIQIAKRYRIRASDVERMLEGAQVGMERLDPWGAEPPSTPSVAE